MCRRQERGRIEKNFKLFNDIRRQLVSEGVTCIDGLNWIVSLSYMKISWQLIAVVPQFNNLI